MKKTLKITAISLLFAFLGFLLFTFFLFYHSKPKIKGDIFVKGIEKNVEVFTDRWGVPHIFAQNEKDLFFVCGYIHAQERMWQMDLVRRSGFGRLSEILGDVTLVRDKAFRSLGLKEAAQKEFEELAPETKERLIVYCKGINAWMNSRKLNWQPEFLILQYRPEPWSPLDSLIIKEVMSLLLCVDYPSEVVRANLASQLGDEKALQILEKGVQRIPQETENASLANWLRIFAHQGSNNWVITGSRSKSGKPLLANDPHLEISVPPIWYEVHLFCPTMNVTGVSLPGIPMVIIGHNDSIAWGLTNSAADVQDLYFEKLNSSEDMYLDAEEWKPLEKREENIWVKGKKNPEILEIKWTNRGPIISPEIIQSEKPISLRWTIYEGGQTTEAFYRINKANDWDEFKEAVELFDAPSQNFVYADIEGNIGYLLSGKIPLRSEDAALFPFPGWLEKGSWTGYIKESEKPSLFNPEEGIIVTANNKIIPDNYPHYVSVDWDVSFRAERIKELLLQRKEHNIDSFKRIQNDVFSKQGELFLNAVKELNEQEEESSQLYENIRGWDLQMASGKEPVLFKAFMNSFLEDVFKDELGDDFESFDFLFRRKEAGLLRILTDPQSLWFDIKDTPKVETRNDIIKMSLEKAYNKLSREKGNPEDWDWMQMHSLHFQHALGRVALFKPFNRGPFPMSGDAFTVRASFSSGYKTTHGASYRQVIDLSDWEKSVCVITSGQSGHFLSPFYDNQIPLWLEGRYHPMLFDSENIEKNSIGIIRFKPKVQKQP